MENLPTDLQNIIYDYQTQLNYSKVMDEIKEGWINTEYSYIDGWYTYNSFLRTHYYPIIHNTEYGKVYGGLLIKKYIDSYKTLD